RRLQGEGENFAGQEYLTLTRQFMLTHTRQFSIVTFMARSECFEQALARYQRNEFTDADVTACTGLSARSIRQLIKVGAVCTLSGDWGAGYIRRFDATTFKRLALASAIHDAGSSLTLAGQLAYLLPGDARLYARYDPISVLFDTTSSVDCRGECPPRLETPW